MKKINTTNVGQEFESPISEEEINVFSVDAHVTY